MLCRAIRDCRDWPDQYVSINVSPQQFRGLDLEILLKCKCDAANLPYDRVQVEVTETAPFDDPQHSVDVLRRIRNTASASRSTISGQAT